MTWSYPRNRRRFLILLLLGAICPTARPQTSAAVESEEIVRLVRAGDVESLDRRFQGGRTFDELRLLALAQTNRAGAETNDEARQGEFENARSRYLAWIAFADNQAEADRLVRQVDGGRARLALGEMMLTRWAASDLDEFEITGGRSTHATRLLALLLKTRDVLNEARQTLQPLAEELADANRLRDENAVERFLIAGVYETLPRAALNARYNLAWTNLYVGMIDPQNLAQRAEALRTAEQLFQQFTQTELPPETAGRCRLGLALTHREQARYEDARRAFAQLAREASDPVLAAQIRAEWAVNESRCGRFDEAREILKPLLAKDPDILPPTEAGARFYLNLARLRFAESYLLEADYLEKTAGKSPALAELVKRARQLRETGLLKMNELAARGGSWPTLVRSYVADTLNAAGETDQQDSTALLFEARRAIDEERFRDALTLIEKAQQRDDLPTALAGDLLFEQGICRYRLDENRTAAELFTRLVREYPSNPRAARAATYAQLLWTNLAEQSKDRADYSRLADVLLALIQYFPTHEEREAAVWRLPAALQAAGRYREAAEQYGNVPAASPQHAEAQYRRVACLRQAYETEAAELSEEERHNRALLAARSLEQYADLTERQAANLPVGSTVTVTPSADDLRSWSAAAAISAAEMYAAAPLNDPERALRLLDALEQRHASRYELGRVLVARIDALRALGRYDEATQSVDRFLRDVPADQAGGTLAALARGMREEVERLERLRDADAAKRAAEQSIPIFERLEEWSRAAPERAKYLDAVHYGLAHMYCSAGRFAEAEPLARALLDKDTRDGSYLRLNALALTGLAGGAEPAAERLNAAREAWGAILRDTSLREKSPERYGEARYHYLSLMLREGRAAEVENAIRQERVWRPERTGTDWDAKIDALYEEAQRQTGQP